MPETMCSHAALLASEDPLTHYESIKPVKTEAGITPDETGQHERASHIRHHQFADKRKKGAVVGHS